MNTISTLLIRWRLEKASIFYSQAQGGLTRIGWCSICLNLHFLDLQNRGKYDIIITYFDT